MKPGRISTDGLESSLKTRPSDFPAGVEYQPAKSDNLNINIYLWAETLICGFIFRTSITVIRNALDGLAEREAGSALMQPNPRVWPRTDS